MTVVNAASATESVAFHPESDQFDFAMQDLLGVNSATRYSWLSSGGDDVQADGSAMDFTASPPSAGLAESLAIDLSNDGGIDVVLTGLTGRTGGGGSASGRMAVLTAGAPAFFEELMSFDDVLTGCAQGDIFLAGAGNDRLTLGEGDDSGHGGAGNDRVDGGDGEDELHGGGGNDRVFGRTGNDFATGDGGEDTISGDDGDDELRGNAGRDRLDGGEGEDVIDGGAGADTLRGAGGDDRLSGGAGVDALSGGEGRDRLDGGRGADRMNGGGGDDVYFVDNSGDRAGEDPEAPGGGRDDVIALASHVLGRGIENLSLGGLGPIDGTGNGLDNNIGGNVAGNSLAGLGGDDLILAEAGDDLIRGGDGDDILSGDQGNDRIRGDRGNDRLLGGAGADELRGGVDADELTGHAGSDRLDGGAGNDSYFYVAADDSSALDADLILSFDRPGRGRGDLISLDAIDAVAGAGDQDFVFRGVLAPGAPPLSEAGALYLRDEAGETIVYGNMDADPEPELRIRIADGATRASAYSAADFDL